MMYKKGSVILVPFPFSDLSSNKIRPAVVISCEDFQKKTGSLTIAMVTSTDHGTPYDCKIENWKDAKLLSPSWVRSKLVTIDPAIIRFSPGILVEEDLNQIMEKVHNSLL